MSERICIVGLGYVGLPLACLSAKYYSVVGLDIDAQKIQQIKQGICPLQDEYTQKLFATVQLQATTDPTCLQQASVVIICVPTPVDKNHLPDLQPLKKATQMVANNLQPGQLIIVESTIYPGTMQEVIIPLLETSGMTAGKDFAVAYCPERIDPGNTTWNLENIPRVLGGLNTKDAARAQAFYQTILRADVCLLNSLKAAEAVKILENTFRDVNIAFINEMAKSFDHLHIDLIEVIRGAATKPFGFMPFYPGPGVGGHCIPVDPYYLIERAKTQGFEHQFLHLARKINLSMPDYVVDLIQHELNQKQVAVNGAKIGILGYAYKRGVADIRESPAKHVIKSLNEKGANVQVYDPHVSSVSTVSSIESLLGHADFIVLLCDHEEFMQLDPSLLVGHNISLLVDTKNCLNRKKYEAFGITYRGIGR